MALDTWELIQVTPPVPAFTQVPRTIYCFSEMSVNEDQHVWKSARKSPDFENLSISSSLAILRAIGSKIVVVRLIVYDNERITQSSYWSESGRS